MTKQHIFISRNLIEFSSADPIETMRQLSKTNTELFHINQKDIFTISFEIKGNIDSEIVRILNRYTESYSIIKKACLLNRVMRFLHRPVMCMGFLLILLLAVLLPSRILFIQVKGNDTLSDMLIISAAEECGIRFGSSRKDIRSEEVKNQLSARLPQIEWVGVNTFGCVAEITVREGNEKSPPSPESTVGNIIASRDGVIIHCTTLRGTQLCKPGQAVKKDQLLVSGYTDCGAYMQGTLAQADILAETNRNLTMITPVMLQKQHVPSCKQRRFRLIIGKYLINFYKDSGISPATCVKIYREYPLKLPGKFILPIRLIEERFVIDDGVFMEVNPSWLEKSGRDYLKSQMVAGKIISEDVQITQLDGITTFEANYSCTEMIGQIKYEETLLTHGYDGKNSKCRTR